jgi:RimJ/RimL family protein N-acetyltransferase
MRPPRPEDAKSWHRRVFGDPDVTRLASIRVMEKIGMEFEGERRAFGIDLVQ